MCTSLLTKKKPIIHFTLNYIIGRILLLIHKLFVINLIKNVYRSVPYDDSRTVNDIKRNTKKIAPFLIGGPGEFFEKNPYFREIIQPTYRRTPKQTFKNTPFIPTSSIIRVSGDQYCTS